MPEPNEQEGRYHLGLKNVHYYSATWDEKLNKLTLGEAKAWKGAVSLNTEVSGDSNASYADDGIWAISDAIPKEELELEMFQIPEDFQITHLGAKRDTDGNIVDGDSDKGSYFALAFEFDQDTKAKRYLYFYCKAAMPSTSSETKKESNEPKPMKIKIKAAGLPGIGRRKVSSSRTKPEVYNSWYTAPKVPTFA